MKSALLYCVLFNLILLFGCKPKYTGPTIIEGQVVDNYTLKPVPFANVKIFRDRLGSWTAAELTVLDEATTGADGKFSFSFEAEEDFSYFIQAKGQHYYENQMQSLETGKINKKEQVKLLPFGWIEIKLIDIPPTDTLWYFNFSSMIGNSFSGLIGDTVLYGVSIGGKYSQEAYWIQKKNQPEYHIKDSIYLKPLDTVEYIIKY